MQKRTLCGITIIALVIGAFGFTFGYLAMTQPGTINPIVLSQIAGTRKEAIELDDVIQTWYNFYEDGVSTTSVAPNFVNITQMNTTIQITGNKNVSLYLCFNSIGKNDADEYLYLRFALNGIAQDPPQLRIQYSGWQTLYLQQIITNVTPGQHLIQVQYCGSAGNTLVGDTDYGMSLVIQSLRQ
ncbi:MAG: hypothetical protein ACFFCM_15060 [Promethearchaeota archaeon]